MNKVPHKKNKLSSGPVYWTLLILGLVTVTILLYGQVVAVGPSTEMDFVWISVGDAGASWLSYPDQIAGLFQKPIVQAIGNAKPGSWIFHFIMGIFFQVRDGGRLLVILLLLVLNSMLVGILAHLLYGNRAVTAASAAIFALHPQLSGTASMISSGGPLLALFWLLVAFISLLCFKQQKRFFYLIPMTSAVFLCHATHNIGLVIIPAMFFLDIATQEGNWTPKGVAGLIGRQLLVFFSFIFFTTVWLPTNGISEMVRIVVALKLIRPAILALGNGMIRLLLPVPSMFDFRNVFGLNIGQLFVFFLPVLLGIAIAGIFKKRKRLFPLALVVVGIIFQAPNMLTIGNQSPSYSICFLVPAIGLAILIGDLLARIQPKAAAYLAIFAFLSLCAVSDIFNANHWARQGQHVHEMADQLETIYENLGNSPDIFIVGAGQYTEPMLAAHLDFVRRYGITKPTRFSYIEPGKVMPAKNDLPTGQSPRGTSRLFLDDSMTFVGYSRQGEFTDLSELIQSKIARAQRTLDTEKKLITGWELGTENEILKWPEAAGTAKMLPVEDSSNITWYIEGQMVNLHPLAGRHLVPLY